MADFPMVAAALLGLLAACAAGPVPGGLDHPDGRPARRGTLVDGRQQGEWTFWHPNGQLAARGDYHRDERTGQWTHWHDNGALRMRGAYRNGRQEGPWEFWHDNGQLQCRGSYRDGREDGEWTFHGRDGARQQQGWLTAGKRWLWWTEWAPDGAVLASGPCWDDQPVGRWQVRGADGAEALVDHALPDGLQPERELWPDGSVRREGFRRDGRAEGPWLLRHPGGALRAAAAFAAGEPVGEFAAYCADGALLARGPLAAGRPTGRWLVRGGAGLGEAELADEPVPPWDRRFSDAAIADREPPAAVAARWLAELAAPAAAVGVPVAAPAAAPAAAPTPAMLLPRREAPTDPGAFTLRELREMPVFRAFYRSGFWPRSSGAASRYGGGSAADRPGHGDAALAAACTGKPLPHTVFPTAGGEPLDLQSLRGKRVLLVVLRGFTTQVCVYCFQQTAELAPLLPQFAAHDCEVVVLFPGSRSRLDAFAAVCRDEFGDTPPPYRLVYDPDLALAKALGLQGNLARPAAFALDREGVVRRAYVAESIDNVADRPPASDLLRWVQELR